MNTVNNAESLYFKSKKVSLIVLAVTAMVCSRMLFVFFNDPEGPNLLIVTVMALFIYGLSSVAYLLAPLKINGIGRLVAVVATQVLIIAVLYLLMR